MKDTLKKLSNFPIKTKVSLSGKLIVARDSAHAKLLEMLDNGKGLPEYFKDDSFVALLEKTDSLAAIQLSLDDAILFEFFKLWTNASSSDRPNADPVQLANANAKASVIALPPNCMCFTLYPQLLER